MFYFGKRFNPVTKHQIIRTFCSLESDTLTREVDYRAPHLRQCVEHIGHMDMGNVKNLALLCKNLPVQNVSDKSRLLHYASGMYHKLAVESGDVTYLRDLQDCLDQNARLVSTQGRQITPLHKILLQGIAVQGMEVSQTLAQYSQQQFNSGDFDAYTDMLSNAMNTMSFHQHYLDAGRLYLDAEDQLEFALDQYGQSAVMLKDYDVAQAVLAEIDLHNYRMPELCAQLEKVPRGNTQ